MSRETEFKNGINGFAAPAKQLQATLFYISIHTTFLF
jgi:hypothetical protein